MRSAVMDMQLFAAGDGDPFEQPLVPPTAHPLVWNLEAVAQGKTSFDVRRSGIPFARLGVLAGRMHASHACLQSCPGSACQACMECRGASTPPLAALKPLTCSWGCSASPTTSLTHASFCTCIQSRISLSNAHTRIGTLGICHHLASPPFFHFPSPDWNPLPVQFSQGKDPAGLTVKEVVENFARNHERQMAFKVRRGEM